MNKYGARKTVCTAGHNHDSKREALRCDELHVLQRAKLITNLQVQHQFWFALNGKELKHPNGRRAGFKADFFYTQLPGLEDVAEDTKGYVVRDYPLRALLFRHCFPDIELREL